ncbi:NAD(P)-dependent alcohol dehydrogenase [Phenylobacterium sp.]|jgi:NADPH:quinone reductase-like Zn-dependent oxidoreductase|uniref:zinc-dependent alcohol dehydrogenase family protein n=1 Tax=Phenylobacterium sp. TaxID=1871053 RepID=UPI002F3EB9DA
MKAMTLKAPGGLDKLVMATIPDASAPKAGEITVRLHASSLNYHDYAVASGWKKCADNRILLSDGAGEVAAVGEGVDEFAVGDNVLSMFFPEWLNGDATPHSLSKMPGDTIDGYAREFVTLPAVYFTKTPPGLSHAEAATLCCAGLTAWRGLVVAGQVKPGDFVLVQGSGGVSVFALQFAKAAGATVVATSSSDEKLERLMGLGADYLINYKQEPEWGQKAKELTDGRGVDHVIEIGGAGTLPQSITALRMGGHIAMIGVLAGLSGDVPTGKLFSNLTRVTGIMVGSRKDQLDMNRAVAANGIKPVIDSTFPLESMADALRRQEAQKHFGKICLEI